MIANWKTPFKLLGIVCLVGFTGCLTLEVLAQSAPVQDIDQPTEESTPIILDQVENDLLNGVQERGLPQKQQAGGLPLNQVVPMDQKIRGKNPGAMGMGLNVDVSIVVGSQVFRESDRIKSILQGADKNLNGNQVIPNQQQSPSNKAR